MISVPGDPLQEELQRLVEGIRNRDVAGMLIILEREGEILFQRTEFSFGPSVQARTREQLDEACRNVGRSAVMSVRELAGVDPPPFAGPPQP